MGGHELTGTAQTFTDAMGSLTASYAFNTATGKGTISYSYTLLDNALGIPNASFVVMVTDKDGESSPPANLVISVVDDVPVARADTDTLPVRPWWRPVTFSQALARCRDRGTRMPRAPTVA